MEGLLGKKKSTKKEERRVERAKRKEEKKKEILPGLGIEPRSPPPPKGKVLTFLVFPSETGHATTAPPWVGRFCPFC